MAVPRNLVKTIVHRITYYVFRVAEENVDVMYSSFVRAELEGDWPLRLWAGTEMVSYFFAVGHQNYGRCGLYYHRSMERLHGDIRERFTKGEHVVRHKKGLWNGIWSDMHIESTFMRYGHDPHEVVGVMMKPSALKKWAYSRHTCSQIVHDLTDMSGGHTVTEVTTTRKRSHLVYDQMRRTDKR